MRETTEALQNPRNYLMGLSRTNEFIEARRQGDPIPTAMATAAMRGVESMRGAHNGRLDIKGNALHLIATIPDFIVSQAELDRIRTKEERSKLKIPREVKVPHLKKVTSFNHALREMIDDNPKLDATAVHGFIIKTGMGVYRRDELDLRYLSQESSTAIVGMQQEIAAEQALWLIDGVDDIENADIDDELEGADLLFTYHGQPFSIDVKASASGEQKAWQQWKPGNSLPFWTGVSSNELGNRFRASDEQVRYIAGRLEGLLLENLHSERDYAIM